MFIQLIYKTVILTSAGFFLLMCRTMFVVPLMRMHWMLENVDRIPLDMQIQICILELGAAAIALALTGMVMLAAMLSWKRVETVRY